MSATTDSGSTRSSLLRRAKAHDSVAWNELVDLYGPLVHYWCRRCGLDEHASSDCLQDVFSAVSRSLSDFQPCRSEGAFRGWLWTITANKVRDWMRREPRHQATGGTTALRSLQDVVEEVELPGEEPTDAMARNQLIDRAMQQVRDEFAEKTWSMFHRSVVDNIATQLVADEFGVSAATVRQARSRVLRRLREQLGDL